MGFETYSGARGAAGLLSPRLCDSGEQERRTRDRYGRRIDYLRMAVTDRCNLRCIYCMPEQGVPLSPRSDTLRFEDYWRIAAAARRLGFVKFRVTGGEPLVVRNVLGLIDGLRRSVGGATLALTTNGVLLHDLAEDLKASGIERVNISLDTLDAHRFVALTRRDGLSAVLRGLDRALTVGFEQVKVNAVIVPGVNEDALLPLASLAKDRPIHVRFIEQMPLERRSPEGSTSPTTGFLGAEEILRRLRTRFTLEPARPEDDRASAQLMFSSSELLGQVGVVAPRSQKFCHCCNRLRLLPTGELVGCLLSEGTLPLLPALRAGVSDEGLDALLLLAIGCKPREHQNRGYGVGRAMSAMGG